MVGMTLTVDGMEDVSMMLDRFRGAVPNARPVLEDMAVHVRTHVFADTFKRRGLPGRPWVPLSARYAAWKAQRRPGAGILEFDGDLEASMTTPRGGVFKVTRTGFEVGTDVPYARFHQDGSPSTHLPARPIIGPLGKRDRQALVKMLQAHIIREAST